jgi:hypothetical protein
MIVIKRIVLSVELRNLPFGRFFCKGTTGKILEGVNILC